MVTARQDQDEPPGLPAEAVGVWLLFAIVGAEIVATYSRLPAAELYHVSRSGLEGGASRLLVFLNFPTALVALAILGLIHGRLRSRRARALALLAGVLCLPVFWPGVVSQANLDAKPINAVAGAGVVLALGLCAVIAVREGISRRPRRPSDRVRVAIAVLLVLAALPWLAAELGFFLNGVPVLDKLFQTGGYLKQLPGLPPFPPAVHHGDHHGMNGLLLVLSALLLSRRVTAVRFLAAYLAVMLCYGLGNIANDFWTEQVFKRGWTTWQIPNVLEPRLTIAWTVIVVAAGAVWWAARRMTRRPA